MSCTKSIQDIIFYYIMTCLIITLYSFSIPWTSSDTTEEAGYDQDIRSVELRKPLDVNQLCGPQLQCELKNISANKIKWPHFIWFLPDIDFPILVSYTAVLGCMLSSKQCSQYMVFDTNELGFDLLKQHDALFLIFSTSLLYKRGCYQHITAQCFCLRLVVTPWTI